MRRPSGSSFGETCSPVPKVSRWASSSISRMVMADLLASKQRFDRYPLPCTISHIREDQKFWGLGKSAVEPRSCPVRHGHVPTRAQLLLVERVVLCNVHPAPAVESGGSRGALGVHAQAHLPYAATVERAEGVPEQREPQPSVSPRTPHGYHVHLSPPGDRLAQARARDLTSVLREEPQAGVEALLAGELQEALDGATGPAPDVAEGILHRLVGGPLVLFRN